MKIRELLEYGKSNLIKKEEPCRLSKILLKNILNVDSSYLLINSEKEINKETENKYKKGIEDLKSGKPLQYITNKQEFMGLDFYVDENVLIPQPDTEILVEEVIEIAKRMEKPKILDLCTGSGAIAISIAKNVPSAEVWAIDISEKALEVAKKNANNLQAKVKFKKSNLFNNINKTKFDIIVSNPPYIKKADIKLLSNEVQKEPEIALDGGYDGLDFYRKIASQAIDYLKFGSYLCFEIGFDQQEDVTEIIKNTKHFNNTYCKKDLFGNDRVIVTKVN